MTKKNETSQTTAQCAIPVVKPRISHFIDENGNNVDLNAEGVNVKLKRDGTLEYYRSFGFAGRKELTPVYGACCLTNNMKEEDKDLNYWKENAKDAYMTTPICVLRYITELEKAVKNNAVLSLVVRSLRFDKPTETGWQFDPNLLRSITKAAMKYDPLISMEHVEYVLRAIADKQ